jgi:hypothetical protein
VSEDSGSENVSAAGAERSVATDTFLSLATSLTAVSRTFSVKVKVRFCGAATVVFAPGADDFSAAWANAGDAAIKLRAQAKMIDLDMQRTPNPCFCTYSQTPLVFAESG